MYCMSFFNLRHSDYSFGIFKHLAIVLSVLQFKTFWLPLWYLQTFGHCIVCLSFNLRLLITSLVSSNIWPLYCLVLPFKTSDYLFGIFKLLAIVRYCLSFFNLRLLIAPLLSSNCWPLYCLSFNLRLLITPFGVFKHLSIVLYVLLWFKTSEYPFAVFKLLAIVCLSFNLRLLITPLVSSNFWPLYCLSFNLRLLITPLLSSNFWPLYCLPVLQFKTSDYPFAIFKLLAIICLSFNLRLLITPLLSSNFWPLYCLSFNLRLLITPLVFSNFSW